MPQFDLRHIYAAKYVNTNGTISYTNAQAVGDAMTAKIELRYAEGRLYAESTLAEYMRKAVGGTISLGVKYINANAQKLLFGNRPKSRSISYTFSYVNTFVASIMDMHSQTVQSINLSGNVSLTKNWRIAMTTGYDFVNKGMSYTTVDIYRDLHCWEMRFSWVPFGYYQSWFFQINIKADALHDVKYEKRQSYQENNGYYSY